MIDPEMIPTDDLIQELLSRSDYGIVAIVSEGADEMHPNSFRCIIQQKGNPHECLGLSIDVHQTIQKGLDALDNETKPDEAGF